MRKSAFQAALPAFTAVMQVGSPSSQFAGRVHLYPICSPHNTDHLPFGHYISTAHASPLGNMLYALNSFLGHLQPSTLPYAGRGIEYGYLPIFTESIIATFVFLAADNLTKIFIELQFDALLFTFLAFLLIRGVVVTLYSGLEDFGLHCEEIIQ